MDKINKPYVIVFFASISYSLLMIVWFSFPAYLPVIIKDVGLSNTEAGILAGAIPLTYIPLSIFSGLAVDRLGPRQVIGGGVILYGVGQIGRSFASDFLSLLILTLIMGIGATSITFSLPKLVSLLFPARMSGRPSALYLVAAMAGSASVFALGRPVIGPLIGGWRALFFWTGFVAIAYAFIWIIVSEAYYTDLLSTKENENISMNAILSDIRTVLTHSDLQLVVIIGTMYLLINHSMQAWLPTLLESRGVSPTLAGQSTSLYVITYVVGILLIPELVSQFRTRCQVVIFCGGIITVGVGGLILSESILFGLIYIAVAGLGTGGLSPLIRTLPPEFKDIGVRLTGTAIGFVFTLGEVGGFLGPVLIGVSHDILGSYTWGFVIMAIGGIIIMSAGERLLRADHMSQTE